MLLVVSNIKPRILLHSIIRDACIVIVRLTGSIAIILQLVKITKIASQLSNEVNTCWSLKGICIYGERSITNLVQITSIFPNDSARTLTSSLNLSWTTIPSVIGTLPNRRKVEWIMPGTLSVRWFKTFEFFSNEALYSSWMICLIFATMPSSFFHKKIPALEPICTESNSTWKDSRGQSSLANAFFMMSTHALVYSSLFGTMGSWKGMKVAIVICSKRENSYRDPITRTPPIK